MQLRVKDTTLFVRLAEGTFPGVDRVVPRATDTRITVETAALRRALGAVSLFGDAAGGRPVRIEAGNGRLRLLAKAAETGDAETKLPAKISGGPQVVALSTPLVADVLAAAAGRQLELDLNGPAAPVVLREAGDDAGGLWLVMPLLTVDDARAGSPPAAALAAEADPPQSNQVATAEAPTGVDDNEQASALPKAA